MISQESTLTSLILQHGEFTTLRRCFLNTGYMAQLLQLKFNFSPSGSSMHLEWDCFLLIMENQSVYNFHLKTTIFRNIFSMSTETQQSMKKIFLTMTIRIKRIYLRREERDLDFQRNNFGKANSISSLDWTAVTMLRNLSSKSGLKKLLRKVKRRKAMTSL